MEIKYATTKKEILQWYFRSWKKKLWIYHAAIIGLIFYNSYSHSLKVGGALSGAMMNAAVWSVFAIAFMMSAPLLFHKSQERTLKIGDVGIETRIGKKSGSVPWSRIESVEDKNGVIFITGKNRNGFIVPQRAFADEKDRQAFLGKIRECVSRN